MPTVTSAATKATPRKVMLPVAGGAWLLTTGLAFSYLWSYSSAPGASADPPDVFPSESRLQRSTESATLVMLAHPRCPCTRASIRELARLMAQCEHAPAVHVLFYRPAGFDPDWSVTDLWRSAAGISGVTVHGDEDGREARRFGARTSGQVVLYDRAGKLAFRGGITAGRGHSGDNFGRTALVKLINGGTSENNESPVYGCALHDAVCPSAVAER